MTTKKISKKPSAKKPLATKPASSKRATKGRAAVRRAPTKTTPTKTAAKRLVAPAVEVKAIVGLSTELGVLVAVSTEPQAPELKDFRLAVREPYPRAVSAVKSKCRLAKALIHDLPSGKELAIYLAFIPVPAGSPITGNLLYRVKPAKGAEVFFTAGTQAVEKVETQQLAKILLILEKAFTQILPDIFGTEHFLSKTLADLIEKRNAVEFWKATQAKVEELLKANQSKEALAVLEPLVFQKTPHAQAEKLLGDLLWRAYLKDKPQAQTETTRQFTTERLLFQYLLKVAGPSV